MKSTFLDSRGAPTHNTTMGKKRPILFDHQIGVRCSTEQLARWQMLADEDGRDLADWIRRTLDRVAKDLSSKKK
jgi:hypothetical protein